MSHYLDSGMFRSTPWHKLGVVVEKAPSISEAIQLAGMDWRVKLEPALYNGKETGYKFVVREDTEEVFNTVKKGYTPLQNEDAFNWFDFLLAEGDAELESAISLKGGRRVAITARLNIAPQEIVPGSPVLPYLLLANSHDGTLSVWFQFTPINPVCWNTLSASLATKEEDAELGKALKIKHTKSLDDKMAETKHLIDLYGRKFDASVQEYKILASRQNSRTIFEEYMSNVFKDDDIAHSRNWDKLWTLYQNGKGSDNKYLTKTFYWNYMVLTEFTNEQIRAKNEEQRLDSNWFGNGAKLRERGLEVALNMSKFLARV